MRLHKFRPDGHLYPTSGSADTDGARELGEEAEGGDATPLGSHFTRTSKEVKKERTSRRRLDPSTAKNEAHGAHLAI